MKAIIRAALVSVALVGAGQALAAGHEKKEPNCEIKGKKSHVKDASACTKKKGTWIAAPAAAAPAAEAPAAEAPAAAPAAAGEATTAPATK